MGNSFVLVTGGTGLIGGEIILRLSAAGTPVLALVRAGSVLQAQNRLAARLRKSEAYRPGLMRTIHAIPGDVVVPQFGAPAAAFRGLRAIVHCAADTKFKENGSTYRNNVAAARNLVALAREAAPSARILYVSTAAVVTAPAGACVDETAPLVGYANDYTRSKREGETIINASGLDAVVVRPSIVLSRGVRDRVMARSILWSVPIMGELGAIPVDSEAHIDIVPADFVSEAIARLVARPALRYRCYHISAGERAESFAELHAVVARGRPALRRVRMLGRGAVPRALGREWLLRPLMHYLPFINADMRYRTDRLFAEIGEAARAPACSSYLETLLKQVTLREACDEMNVP